MTTATAAAVTCEIRREGGAIVMEFRRRGETGKGASLVLEDPDCVARAKASISSVMETFRKAAGLREITIDGPDFGRVMSLLSDRAWGFLHTVSQSPAEANRFAVELTELMQPVFSAMQPDAPLIEVLAPRNDSVAWLLPIELFPMTNAEPTAPLAYYLGFRAIVSRKRCGSHAFSPFQSAASSKRIRAKLFTLNDPRLDRKYPGIFRQLTFFTNRSDVSVEVQWPGDEVSPDPTGQLAGQLLSSLQSVPSGEIPRRILHFACHYRRGDDVTLTPDELDFGNTRVEVVPLMGRMTRDYVEADLAGTEMLVFLNACETGARRFGGVSLMSVVSKQGFPHVIASETLVPDRIAGEFAVRFYEALLQGQTLGASVLQARRDLLNLSANPFGLLYSSYGDPDLRVTSA